MKRKIALLLTFILTAVCFGSLSACGPKNPYNPETVYNLNIDYITSFMADISDAAALGIKKGGYNKQTQQIGYTSRTARAVENEEKNYLIKETAADKATEYVDFKKIGETLTQEAFPAQVNKIYVMNGFTFIQFIPVVSESDIYRYLDNGVEKAVYIEVRPSDELLALNIDNKGIPLFDKTDYFSDELHASFVIDNESGNVYKIEGIHIDKLNNGLLEAGGLVYDMEINGDDELKFYSLNQNATIYIANYFKDIYGNNYIENDSVNKFDETTNTLFFKIGVDKYLFSNEGYTVYILDSFTEGAKVMDGAMQKQVIKDTDKFTFSEPCRLEYFHEYNIHIENGFIFATRFQSGAYSYYHRVNIETLEYSNVNYGIYSGAGFWSYDCLRSAPLAYNRVLIWTDTATGDGIGTLYWGEVYGENAYTQTDEDGKISIENLIELLPDCQSSEEQESGWWWGGEYNKLVFRVIELSGTIYYRIVLDSTGTPQIVKESEYIADNQKVVILQPLR